MAGDLLSSNGGPGRGFRHIVTLLVLMVISPTVALLVLGILMLVFWTAQLNILFGILVVTLVALMVTGTVLVLILLRREAELSKLQLDFVSKVSHELRTPLTSIGMFAETLQLDRARDAAETDLCLDVLHKETDRLRARIERLLDWGRMESGRRLYRLQADTVEAVIAEAVEAFAPTAVSHAAQITVEMEPHLPPILADRGALTDALVNLLSNAVKYSGDDRLIAVHAAARGKTIRVSVKDNGIGIPWHEQRRIFEKFYRVDERLSRGVEGSGLGLAIVRHVVAGHKGRVEVSSEPGTGSTFTIVLPRARAA